MRKRVAALVACFCFLILTVFSAGAVDGGTADGPGEPEAAVPADSTQDGAAQGTEPVAQAESGYSVVAENDGYRLYADMQTGDFALLDIAEDRLWYSGQWDVLDQDSPSYDLNVGKIKTDLVSMLAVDFVQLSTIASTPTPTNQNSYAYCVVKDNVTVQTVADGYRADYYFEDVGITIPVEILLKEDGLSVRIIGSEIQMGEEYWVTAIQLLPGFMAGDDRYDGYLFVPSGSGALIELNAGRGSLASYSQMVYGDDAAIEVEEFEGLTQNILVPVYGMKYGDGGITAIITQGDGFANICADSNSLDTSFSRVYCEYVTAIVDDTTLFESNFENQRVINGIEQRESFSDFQVDFTVMGSGADYSRMAQIYREYLIENGLEKRAGPPELFVTLYGAATRKASFLGIPYTKTFALTSFSDAQAILEDLNGGGAPVSLQYIGWNNSGVENRKVAAKFSPVGVLGGKSGYRELDSFLSSSSNSAYFDLDPITVRKSGSGFSVLSDTVKTIFNTRTPQYKYMRSVYVPVNTEDPWYLLNSNKALEAVQKFVDSDPYGNGISLYGAGEMLYSDFTKNSISRAETIANYQAMLETLGEREIAVNSGNAYVYNYVDKIYSLPTTNDGNVLFSCSVPFVQMVLHGYVSYGAEQGDSLLDCIALGANPYYCGIAIDDSELIETSFNWLYGSSYDNWSEQAKADFAAFNEVYATLYDQALVSYEEADGVSRTVFENGTVILVNRTEQAATVEGMEVPAQDYCVIGG
ncbi:MAG TPA: hypothetical protein H9674_00975 [Firmicutes bacterium]|nr:hypothetical protein [Bacillota bacterium]